MGVIVGRGLEEVTIEDDTEDDKALYGGGDSL
jgi:hypothetical protein